MEDIVTMMDVGAQTRMENEENWNFIGSSELCHRIGNLVGFPFWIKEGVCCCQGFFKV